MEFEIHDLPLPCRIRLDEPMTDAELLRFSDRNEILWLEREPDGWLYVKPTGGGTMSLRSMAVNTALSRWA